MSAVFPIKQPPDVQKTPEAFLRVRLSQRTETIKIYGAVKNIKVYP